MDRVMYHVWDDKVTIDCWRNNDNIQDFDKILHPAYDEKIKEMQEEVKKKINRPVPELAIAEDTEIMDVKSSRHGNGKGHAPASHAPASRQVKTLSDSVAHFQQDAPTCPSCGHVTVRNGACYKCINCGESLGCS